MNGKNPKYSSPGSCVDFTVAVLGAATSAPTLPADGDFRHDKSTYPRRANKVSTLAAEAPTRTGAGVYVVTMAEQLANILYADAVVLAAGASPTGDLSADVTKVDAPNRKLYVTVSTPAGVATDIGTNDMLVFYVHAQDSTV